MKKVTIPTCANPFVVMVNGMKYTYPAGETVEVPDDVAAVIEQHDEAHNNPAPDPAIPPYSSGAKSWNDLTDKPFGDETVTIEWDGDSTGKVTVLDGQLVKVSDLTPEPTELIGGTIAEYLGGGHSREYPITEEDLEDNRAYGVPVLIVEGMTTTGFYVAYEPFSTTLDGVDITVTEPGVYFINYRSLGLDLYIKQLTYNSIKKLDPKFLPEGVGGGLPTLEFTTTFTSESTELTAEETAAVFEFFSKRSPFVGVFDDERGVLHSLVFNSIHIQDYDLGSYIAMCFGEMWNGQLFEYRIELNENYATCASITFDLS